MTAKNYLICVYFADASLNWKAFHELIMAQDGVKALIFKHVWWIRNGFSEHDVLEFCRPHLLPGDEIFIINSSEDSFTAFTEGDLGKRVLGFIAENWNVTS